MIGFITDLGQKVNATVKTAAYIDFSQSATTSRAEGMRKAPGRGQALPVVADWEKEFWFHVTWILLWPALIILNNTF
jgi:hypothetical protein